MHVLPREMRHSRILCMVRLSYFRWSRVRPNSCFTVFLQTVIPTYMKGVLHGWTIQLGERGGGGVGGSGMRKSCLREKRSKQFDKCARICLSSNFGIYNCIFFYKKRKLN